MMMTMTRFLQQLRQISTQWGMTLRDHVDVAKVFEEHTASILRAEVCAVGVYVGLQNSD
jgi:hypothetical protein